MTLIKKFLHSIPSNYRDTIFSLLIKFLPVRFFMLIPCSYTAYLKCYFPQKGDVVMDCGAHIGNNTLLFSKLVGKQGLVIALEPIEESFIKLQRKVNKLNNVVLIKKGLWKETASAPIEFRIFSDTNLGANVSNEINKDVAFERRIESISLDDLTRD
jgi:FkbM family methyltransferase